MLKLNNKNTRTTSMMFQCVVIETKARSSHSEVLLEKAVLKIRSKSTGEHPYRSAKQLY